MIEEVANILGDKWYFRNSHLGQTGGRKLAIYGSAISVEKVQSAKTDYSPCVPGEQPSEVSSFSGEDRREAGGLRGKCCPIRDGSGELWEQLKEAQHGAVLLGLVVEANSFPLERRQPRHRVPVKGVHLLVIKIQTTVNVGMHSFN